MRGLYYLEIKNYTDRAKKMTNGYICFFVYFSTKPYSLRSNFRFVIVICASVLKIGLIPLVFLKYWHVNLVKHQNKLSLQMMVTKRYNGISFLQEHRKWAVFGKQEPKAYPISPQSGDPSDLSVPTPGHFLTGGPVLAPLDPLTTETPIAVVNRW